MKKHLTLFVLLFLVSIQFFGQRDEKSRKKIMSAKISFISDELSLSSAQAEKFWPIYKSFKDSIYTLHKEKRAIERNVDYNNISEKEALKLIDEIRGREKEIEKKRELFFKEITKVITNKQFLKLNHTEHEFKKNLLERIKHKD